MIRKIIFISMLCLTAMPFFLCTNALALTGRDVMVMVDEREDGDDSKALIEMTLINHRGKKRIRQMISYRKDYGKDSKKIMCFKKPADVKGTSFLSWEWDIPDRDDDKWLYMPALRKVRRISGESTNDYFMGSDFTYDDMGKRNVDEDTHTLICDETINGSNCWKIESLPLEKDTYYDKKVLWVNKDARVIIKAEYYDSQGLIKTFSVKDLKRHNGIWTIFKMEMENKRENHTTTMRMSDVQYDIGVADSFFQVSTISRGIVR